MTGACSPERAGRRAVAEQEREQQAGDEAADVGHEGDAADVLALRGGKERARSADHLQYDPEAQHQNGRHGHDLVVDQHPDAGVREHEQVGAERAGYRTRGANVGNPGAGRDVILSERRGNAAHQVEDEELHRSEIVLDVVAEDPEVEHVATEVQPTGVHEHGGEDGGDGAGRVLREAPRYEGPLVDERVAAAQLDEEKQDVERNQPIGHDGQRPAALVVIADRKHGPPPFVAAAVGNVAYLASPANSACRKTRPAPRETPPVWHQVHRVLHRRPFPAALLLAERQARPRPMKLYRAFATVGGLTMVSRVLGFARDILIAATLGSGAVADAFFVAFRFPNLFRRLFGEGAFNSAFVPLFAGRLESEGREAARAFAEEALAGLVFVLLLLTAVSEIAMPFLMLGLAPGFNADPEKFDLAVLLTRITMPYLLCMSVVALLSGVLNSIGKFVESSAVSIVLNLTMMAATLIALAMGLRNDPLAGIIQAWGVFVAGLLQLWLLIDGARRYDLSLKLRLPRLSQGVRRLVRLGIPGVIAGGVTQLNIMIGTIVASLQDGAVSHLYYADRIYELPLAIVGIAVGVVLLPDVTRHLRAGNHAAVMDSQNRSF